MRPRRVKNPSPCSASTSTASRRSTTCLAMRSATISFPNCRNCSERRPEGLPERALGRLGGEEFIRLTPNGDHPALAEILAGRFHAAVTPDLELNGRHLHVGVS